VATSEHVLRRPRLRGFGRKAISMTTDTEQKIFEKLDAMGKEISGIAITQAEYLGGAKGCRKKCERTHDTVFGNGSVGLRAKVWVLWGLLGGAWLVIVAIIKVWAGKP